MQQLTSTQAVLIQRLATGGMVFCAVATLTWVASYYLAAQWLFTMIRDIDLVHVEGLESFEFTVVMGGLAGVVATVAALATREYVAMASPLSESVPYAPVVQGTIVLLLLSVLGPMAVEGVTDTLRFARGQLPLNSRVLVRDIASIRETAPDSPVAARLAAALASPSGFEDATPWLREFYAQQGIEFGLSAMERAALATPARALPEIDQMITRIQRDGVMTRADRIAMVSAMLKAHQGALASADASALALALQRE